MTLTVRPFRRADFEPAVDIWQRAWKAVLPEVDMTGFTASWRHKFAEEILPRLIVVACDCDTVFAGFAILDPGPRFLDHVVVDPDFGRRGIGRLLAQTVRDLAGGPLSFRVLQRNTLSVAFWESLGAARKSETISPSTGWPCWNYQW